MDNHNVNNNMQLYKSGHMTKIICTLPYDFKCPHY